jgi:hypothetical protein
MRRSRTQHHLPFRELHNKRLPGSGLTPLHYLGRQRLESSMAARPAHAQAFLDLAHMASAYWIAARTPRVFVMTTRTFPLEVVPVAVSTPGLFQPGQCMSRLGSSPGVLAPVCACPSSTERAAVLPRMS